MMDCSLCKINSVKEIYKHTHSHYLGKAFVQYIDDHIINSSSLHEKIFKKFSRKINNCGSFGSIGYLLQSREIFSKVFVFSQKD